MSIVRVGLAETKDFAEGYDAIFGGQQEAGSTRKEKTTKASAKSKTAKAKTTAKATAKPVGVKKKTTAKKTTKKKSR